MSSGRRGITFWVELERENGWIGGGIGRNKSFPSDVVVALWLCPWARWGCQEGVFVFKERKMTFFFVLMGAFSCTVQYSGINNVELKMYLSPFCLLRLWRQCVSKHPWKCSGESQKPKSGGPFNVQPRTTHHIPTKQRKAQNEYISKTWIEAAKDH